MRANFGLQAELPNTVMAGLVPAIHVFSFEFEDVDARHRAGHDDAIRRAALASGERL
jgi:hypothetical protein